MAKGRYGQTKPIEATTDDLTIGGGDLIGSDSGEDTRLRLIESRAQLVVDNAIMVDCQPSGVGIAQALLVTGPVTASDPTAPGHLVTKSWALANLQAGGSGSAFRKVTQADSPLTVTDQDRFIFCDTSAGEITVNLPAAATVPRQDFVIKRTGAGASNVIISAADLIEDAASFTLEEVRSGASIFCDGDTFHIF